MIAEPRRENGITVRYLAQTIINDAVLGNQSGINKFVESLVNRHNVSKESFVDFQYYFFLHLEDYGVGDKSEIDFILWNEKVILPVEVKAFTDANSPCVKKEIIRNYLHIDELKSQSRFRFNKKQKIYPVLLYSESYQEWIRRNNSKTDYFNDKFLLTKGEKQYLPIDNWDKGNYKIPLKYFQDEKFDENVKIINKNLFFTTWEKVYGIHLELNKENIFSKGIEELKNIKDIKKDKPEIKLIKS